MENVSARLAFLLWVTDFFHGHWEEPIGPLGETAIKMAIHELAKGIKDTKARKLIQGAVAESRSRGLRGRK